jgi:hypothetical protein
MQMLRAGGMAVLTDGLRRADADNPRGYFEFEPVKAIGNDATWLLDAQGKAVKMAYPLLHLLPDGYSYRIVLTRRDPSEVVASQNAMLRRLGKPFAPIPDDRLAVLLDMRLTETEKWALTRSGFTVLAIRYDSLIQAPAETARRLSEFCGGLDVPAMAAVVDPALYRQRFAALRDEV